MTMAALARSMKSRLLPLAWIAMFIGFLAIAAIPTDSYGQMLVAGFVLLVMFGARSVNLSAGLRILFLVLGAYLTARYFFWRTFSTLGYHDFFSFIGALLLYLAEVYGITLYLLSLFVNIHPLKRVSVPLPADPAQLPTVDVLVPSYNEPLEMLQIGRASC